MSRPTPQPIRSVDDAAAYLEGLINRERRADWASPSREGAS